MGEVYRARDTRLGRDVAIKVVSSAVAADADRVRRFELEARATAALNHPNIMAIYDLGTHEGAPYVVSELLEGESLRHRLSAGPLPASRAVALGIQIAQGLAAAHEKGIVHRDIKPDNIFLTSDGQVKILDFGLAKLLQPERGAALGGDPDKTPALTQTGVVVGTVAYLSPEQARGFPVDPRSDIFACGVVLYEMLAGRSPFAKETPVDTISALLHADPPALATATASLGPSLERIVRHCLEKRPEDRFQSARDLAFDLSALASLPIQAPRARPAEARRHRGWGKLLCGAAAAALTVVVVLLAGWRLGLGHRPLPTYTQKSFRSQTIFLARFAPDGQAIVLSAAQQGFVPEICQLRPEYPEAVPVGLPGAHLLAVSARGELAVLTGVRPRVYRMFVGTLARVPLGGGAPREILEGVQEADWLPDGSDLAILREVDGKDRIEAPVGQTLYESAGYLTDLRVSPHGDLLAFLEHPVRFDNQGAAVIIDRQGRAVARSGAHDAAEGLAWSQDGREVLFSVQCGSGLNSLAINALSTSGRERLKLPGLGRLTIHDVSRDGRWLVTRDDWRLEMMVRAPGETSERDLSWLDSGIQPMLSGDGRTLLFLDQSEAAGPSSVVCMRRTDGSPVVRLGEGTSRDISRDGKAVLAILGTAPPRLRVYPTGAGEVRTIEIGGLETITSASWLGSAGDMLVCGSVPGHASRCHARQASGGALIPVTPEGVTEGWASPDGKLLVVRTGEHGWGLVPVGGGEVQALPGLQPDDAVARWSPEGRALWVWRRPGLAMLVDSYDLGSARRTRLAEIAPRSSIGVIGVRLSLADDPSSYAYQTWQTVSHLFVVEGVR